MAINKYQLVLDTSDLDDSDNVGAFLRASDGTLFTHTTVGSTTRLDTAAALFDGEGNPLSSTLGSLDVNIAPNTSLVSTSKVANDTASPLVTTPLTDRRNMVIENIGNTEVFLGDATVTTSTGILLAGKNSIELELGDSISLHAVCPSGKTSELRVLELA